MSQMTEGWQFWAVLAAVFAAATAIFAKLGVNHIPSDLASLIRTLVVVVLLWGIVLYRGETVEWATVSARAWTFLVLSGLATGASWLCYFRALKLGPASQVAPVDKLSVVFVAILGVAFLGERLTTVEWVGVGLIALGAGLVAFGSA